MSILALVSHYNSGKPLSNYICNTTLFHSRDSIQANIINCTTPQFTGSADSVGLVFVSIDNANVSKNSVQFTFRADPEFNRVTPSNTIFA